MSGTIDRRGATPPDFLVKLLTMVGDEAPDLFSWTGGKLYIHDPVALERKMSVYFRHSNFSSFQRQLNNFGFRKVEGKGKLAPCMYMHDDLVGRPPEAILTIRRKPATSAASDRGQPDAKRQREVEKAKSAAAEKVSARADYEQRVAAAAMARRPVRVARGRPGRDVVALELAALGHPSTLGWAVYGSPRPRTAAPLRLPHDFGL